jgi:hypothetical protein
MANSNEKFEGYMGNPNLKPPNYAYQWTPEEIQEYMKCAKDPEYFIEHYIKIVNLDKGLVPFKLYPFQKRLVKTIHKNRFVVSLLPRQSGKCLSDKELCKFRNKKTGEIVEMTIGDFYRHISSNSVDYIL